MKFCIVLAFVIATSLAQVEDLQVGIAQELSSVEASAPSSTNVEAWNCPSPDFKTKHVCKDCKTLNQAKDFSKKMRKYAPTGTNTVIFGDPQTMRFAQTNTKPPLCYNVEKKPVATCHNVFNPWGNCEWVGQECTTYHDIMKDGHMIYDETNCCPHPDFKTEHICSDCTNPQKALEFAKRMIGKNKVTNYSVIVGDPNKMTFGRKTRVENNVKIPICYNKETMPLYDCQVSANKCTLRTAGKMPLKCRTYHNMKDGQMYQGYTQCGQV